MNFVRGYARVAAIVLLVSLLAALAVTYERVRVEQATRRVEIAMDYNDFLAFARSYNYNPEQFLISLRRAGLTSLALSEELGSNVPNSRSAYVTSGVGLLDSARLAPLADPTLSGLLRAKQLLADEVYLLVYDKPTFERYMAQLPLHFERSGIRVLHASLPYVIALRTQMDYFGSVGLGVPADQVALAKRLHLLVIPRFQNDERLKLPQMQAMLRDLHAGSAVSTVIFFGLRNQVLGFPDNIHDAAELFKANKQLNYGEIETYDAGQVQKGNVELARLIPGRTVRVQAISKLELDKVNVPEMVARYELGARERNVRVIYLRPFGHQYDGRSIEMTNVELVREIADDLRSHGFTLGRATPIPLYHGNNPMLVGLSALAVPAIALLLLGFYGWYRPWIGAAAYAATILFYAGGVLSHHDLFVRSSLALLGALLFAVAALSALAPAFYEEPADAAGAQIVRSLKWTLLATGVALLGALVVIGVLSSPLLMEEVEAFRGVKLVLALPPLVALLLYTLTPRFNAGNDDRRSVFGAPVRIYQLILAVLVVGVGGLVLLRSGNQSDVTPSHFELALRHHLTAILSVRPRFKQFVIGFPMLMLLPALTVAHRRAVGILLVLGIGVGIGDIIDTFSHLHTPVLISLLRIVNGLVIGALIGVAVILVYRALFPAPVMRVLVSGYYGFGNLGDEALLEVITAQLRARFPHIQLDVLSVDPEGTARKLDVTSTPRMDMARVREAVARADVVLSGGGGLLQNATSLRSLLYYAGIVRSAVRCGKHAMIFAQSIGPLDFWGRTIVRGWCKGIERATVRDGRSRALLESLLPGTRVEQTADPVFLYDAPDEEIDLRGQGIGPDSDPLVIVSVRKAANMKGGLDLVAAAVDRLSIAHGARVAFLPLGGAADAEVSISVIRKCTSAPMLLPETSLAGAANLIRRAKAVVGMRLHALILAARYGVPFLAIPYDPKVSSLCEDLAYPIGPLFTPGAPLPSPGAVTALVDRFWVERGALSAHLLDGADRLRALAARNFEVLSELVGEGPSLHD